METQSKKERSKDIEELKLTLEKQIAAAVWVQTIGLAVETILLQRLYSLSEENIEGETQSLIGVMIQLAGMTAEAIGVTQQVLQPSIPYTFEGQRVAITGNWLQSLGAAIEAIGGEKVLVGEILSQEPDFVL